MLRYSLLAAALLTGMAGSAPAQTARLADPVWQMAQADTRDGDVSVRDLQIALGRAGYQMGRPDGKLGPATRRAIADYQRDAGLAVTGEPSSAMIRSMVAGGFLSAPDTRPPDHRMGQAPMGPGEPRSNGRPPRGAGGPETEALVADIQTALHQQGYPVRRATGTLDSETRAAIRAYQRDHGLPATGQPSGELLALIETGGGGRARPGRADNGALVQEAESILQSRGYPVGPVNDRVEPETAQAIRQYQTQRGFAVTGTVTPALVEDLRASATRAPQEARTPEDLLRSLGERALEGLGGQSR